MIKKGAESPSSDKDKFYRMKRGDVQFTTGGTGIAHSEQNEHNDDEVHFLQIWANPWKRGLRPVYHTESFPEETKKGKFVTILSPLKAGPDASLQDERNAIPAVDGTIPIHADFLMGAAIIQPGESVGWKIGTGAAAATNGAVVRKSTMRNVYVHLPARKVGASIQLSKDVVLEEGDGAYITGVGAGDVLDVKSVGSGEAEVVVLDSD